jgi:hypothetical protein
MTMVVCSSPRPGVAHWVPCLKLQPGWPPQAHRPSYAICLHRYHPRHTTLPGDGAATILGLWQFLAAVGF